MQASCLRPHLQSYSLHCELMWTCSCMNTVSLYFDVVALTSYLCSVETWGCVRAHFACHMCFRSYLCIRSQGTTGIFDIFCMFLDGCFRSPCGVGNAAIKFQKCGQCPGNRTPPTFTLHGHPQPAISPRHPHHPPPEASSSVLYEVHACRSETGVYGICNCEGAKVTPWIASTEGTWENV